MSSGKGWWDLDEFCILEYYICMLTSIMSLTKERHLSCQHWCTWDKFTWNWQFRKVFWILMILIVKDAVSVGISFWQMCSSLCCPGFWIRIWGCNLAYCASRVMNPKVAFWMLSGSLGNWIRCLLYNQIQNLISETSWYSSVMMNPDAWNPGSLIW